MGLPAIQRAAAAASKPSKIAELVEQVKQLLPKKPPKAKKSPKAADDPESMIPASQAGLHLQPLGEPIDPDAMTAEWGFAKPEVDITEPAAKAGYVDPWDAIERAKIAQQSAAQRAERQPGENIRDYVTRIREMARTTEPGRWQYGQDAAASATAALEKELADNLRSGKIGPLETQKQFTQDYLDYLKASGVDQRTIDDIASGALPMDPQSRMARAEQMGLDPKAVWFRWDHPLKTQFKGYTGAALSQREFARKKKGLLGLVDLGPSREGLVYTSHRPDFAKRGVQIDHNKITLYPLVGPDDGIAGIDNLPGRAYDVFRDRLSSALLGKYPDSSGSVNAGIRRAHLRERHLAEPLVDPTYVQGPLRDATLDTLRHVGPNSATRDSAQGTVPHYSTAEDRKVYTEPLMATGAKGTLVRDETGISTAFTPAGARQLRRADLAPMDTRFKDARNVLQSLLVPAAVAGGAASQDR